MRKGDGICRIHRQRDNVADWWPFLTSAFLALAPLSLLAQARDSAQAGRPTAACAACAEMNAPQKPLRIHGNTYYVGARGVAAILVTSSEGHVLIDGGLPESAPSIIASIRSLGFRVEDIRLILNSHAHFDHAGGIAAIQRASGATVAASPWSARVIERGASLPDDPQDGRVPPYEPVHGVRVIADGETLRVGPLALTAHFTGGHTPGGTTWSWQSCDAERCLDLVYADSETPVSADGFSFGHSDTYPTVLQDFERSFAVLESLSCDLLITPHPGASRLWERIARREQGERDALVDSTACRRYAASARDQLAKRIASEESGR